MEISLNRVLLLKHNIIYVKVRDSICRPTLTQVFPKQKHIGAQRDEHHRIDLTKFVKFSPKIDLLRQPFFDISLNIEFSIQYGLRMRFLKQNSDKQTLHLSRNISRAPTELQQFPAGPRRQLRFLPFSAKFSKSP